MRPPGAGLAAAAVLSMAAVSWGAPERTAHAPPLPVVSSPSKEKLPQKENPERGHLESFSAGDCGGYLCSRYETLATRYLAQGCLGSFGDFESASLREGLSVADAAPGSRTPASGAVGASGASSPRATTATATTTTTTTSPGATTSGKRGVTSSAAGPASSSRSSSPPSIATLSAGSSEAESESGVTTATLVSLAGACGVFAAGVGFITGYKTAPSFAYMHIPATA